jgi:uncharacterized protein
MFFAEGRGPFVTRMERSAMRDFASGGRPRISLCFIRVTVTLLVLAFPAFAQDLPPLTGRVVDQANVIPPAEEQALDAMLAAHETKTTNQVVVATVASLGGQPIEDYGVALGRAWKIGQAGKDNGVILLVAPNEREVRIEVGYGLEGELTDAISKVIIEGSIIPRFRAGDIPGGIRRGADDIVAVLDGDAAAFAERAKERVNLEDGLFAAIKMLFFIAILFVWIQAAFFRRRGRRRRGSGPVIFGPGMGSSGGGSSWGGSSGGFSGGGGSFGGGGASGRW